jgi:hypothetical protein
LTPNETPNLAALPDLRNFADYWATGTVRVPHPDITIVSVPPDHGWGGTLASIEVMEEPTPT